MPGKETALIIPDASNLAMMAEGWADDGEQLSPFDLDRVRVGGVEALTVPIEGVIVHAQHRRAFFGTMAYSPDGELVVHRDSEAVEGTPPDCSSEDGIHGRGVPGGDCADCPLSLFGSSGDTRAAACKEIRFVYMAKGGELMPTVVQIPPSSLKAYRTYYREVFTTGKPFDAVLTRVSLKPAKNERGVAYNELAFERVRDLDREEREAASAYRQAIQAVFP